MYGHLSKQFGLVTNDVDHIIGGIKNYNFEVVGGIFEAGACNLGRLYDVMHCAHGHDGAREPEVRYK